MFKHKCAHWFLCLGLLSSALVGCSSTQVNSNPPPTNFQLAVKGAGTGAGTVTSTPAGINCGTTCSSSFASGTAVTLSAAPNSGSTFAGWSGSCSGTGACSVTMSANAAVTATFNAAAPANYQLNVQAAGSGAGTITSTPAGIHCGQTCSASFASGSAVTLSATPSAGSTFAGWSGSCSGTGACTVTMTGDASVTATFTVAQAIDYQLSVQEAGSGVGTVTSNPGGINCGQACSASFASGTAVTLSATANAGSTFAGWSGGCSGTGLCSVTLAANTAVTATFNSGSGTSGLSSLNHIIFLAQENRSFDHYFGALRQYWAQNGYPDQSFDGLPQFNPSTGAAPLNGPAPAVPGCDPAAPAPADCSFDKNNPVTSFHLTTQCLENPSPSWNESHVDWNFQDQVGLYAPTLNGFVWTAAHDSRTTQPPYNDTDGRRVMGYYDGTDLNYYYFMASNFATSDRWFNAVMTRTPPNREYLIAGTSQGYVYGRGTDAQDAAPLTATTIFQELQAANISWKIYVNPQGSSCTGPNYDPACLLTLSYVQNFQWGQTIPTQYPQNIAPISQYFTDLQNGTLPQVVLIEPATDAGLDEHPSDSDSAASNSQAGANYVASLINALMQSSSWKDSAFILTFDEFGGFYDHVPPQPAPSPDGIKPVDLLPNDVCTTITGPTCDFTWTGYRVPLLVVSPYAKKNYVSHSVADLTAILKLIETRFNLAALTKRDAAQIDMTEFFDFSNPPWMSPPNPPTQNTSGACYLNQLP